MLLNNYKIRMMKSYFTLTIAILFFRPASFGQATGSLLHFSMDYPEKWYQTTNEEITDNLGKFELTDKELDKYISDHKGSVLIKSFVKYKASEYSGLVPAIQVNLRKNTTGSFEDFASVISKSAEDMKNMLPNFAYIHKPQAVIIGGRKAIYFYARFTMNSKDGGTINARSRTYAVPVGDKFYQISFSDGGAEDCSKLFDDLIKTIKFE
jgi:hypothetical protein